MGRGIRSVLQHLGEMGLKEIARTPSAYLKHMFAAGGAGVVTVITVTLKVSLVGSSFASGFTTCLKTLNFVLSFLFIQFAGFRLATKQSTLFGAAFSARWREMSSHLHSGRPHGRIWDDLRSIVRTQAMSAFGNLAFVAVGGLLFHWVYSHASGAPFLNEAAAKATLLSLHPLESATLLYAALTGVLLWLSSVGGGAIAQRLNFFSKAAISVFFNILLGILLAMVPLIGHWLSLPLDVRHFTLSGGTAALALGSLGIGKALASGLVPALIGILWIGAMNFGVSFALAFFSGLFMTTPRQEVIASSQ